MSALLPIWAALALVACGADPPGISKLDPQLIELDRAAPFVDFDSSRGSILTGVGWAAKEWRRRDHDDRYEFAFSSDQSLIWVDRPEAEELDFVGQCMPFSFEGAKQQKVHLHSGGKRLGSAVLQPGWQLLRIPLPPGALTPGLNGVRLRFEWAVIPNKLDLDNLDDRLLAASCRYLAIVPRELGEPEAFHRATQLDLAERTLHMPLGAIVGFPLAANADVTLRLGRVRSTCATCRLRVELEGTTLAEPLPDIQLNSKSTRIDLTTPPGGLSRLLLRFESTATQTFDPETKVAIRLPEIYLEMIPRTRTAAAHSKPNIFIYLIDTLRADIRSTAGFDVDRAPHFDEFARDAVVYENAWTASSWTLPSVVSILTGTYAFRHGVMRGDVKYTPGAVPPLAALLSTAGYRTLGFSHSFIASSQFGVDSGFDSYYLSNQLNSYSSSTPQTRRFLIDRMVGREEPFLIYTHTVDPHAPYSPAPGYRHFAEQVGSRFEKAPVSPTLFMLDGLGNEAQEVAHLQALYDGEVAHADRQFGFAVVAE